MIYRSLKTEKERKAYFKKQIEDLMEEEVEMERQLKKDHNFAEQLSTSKKNLKI